MFLLSTTLNIHIYNPLTHRAQHSSLYPRINVTFPPQMNSLQKQTTFVCAHHKSQIDAFLAICRTIFSQAVASWSYCLTVKDIMGCRRQPSNHVSGHSVLPTGIIPFLLTPITSVFSVFFAADWVISWREVFSGRRCFSRRSFCQLRK